MTPISFRAGIAAAALALVTLSSCTDQDRQGAAAPAPAAGAAAQARAPDMGSMAFSYESLVAKATAVGALREVCRAPTATLDELEMHITTLNSRGAMPHPPHRHPHEELLIIKEGRVDALVDGQWIPLGPGSIIFQASNVEHAIRNAGDGPATYVVIAWKSAKTAPGAGPAQP
jgi:mannose-6-phosphate isomerase-like protein (cupin superfamily)